MLRSNLLIHLIVCMLVLLTVGCQSATPVPTVPEITPIPEIVTPSATPDELAVVDTPMASVPTTTPEPTLTATHTPSLTPSVTPSPSPTITPSFTPTPSPTPSFTPTPSPTPSFTPTPTDTPTPIPEGSPLKRKENSPAGVASQLGFFLPHPGLPSNSGCTAELRAGSSLVAGVVEVLQINVICLFEFDPQLSVIVTVPNPDGSTEHHEISLPDVGNRFTWFPLPGLPLGDLTVTAQQGQQHASVRFHLRPATQPRILVLPKQGFPGTTFRVALAGFAPNQPLYLYRETNECEIQSQCWEFLTTLTVLTVNDRGETAYDLHTESDDPIGSYLIHTGDQVPTLPPRQEPQSFTVIQRVIPIPIPWPTREGVAP
jgi:hypothetical protein